MNDRRETMSFLDIVWNYKGTLALYIVGVSIATFAFLYYIGGVPDEFKVADATQTDNSAETAAVALPKATEQARQDAVYPERIIISKIGVDAAVENPASSDIDVLNNDLLKGAVRYPSSGTIGKGNMFIFGHSTGYRIVNNQAYNTFNHIGTLSIGDTITVIGGGKEYAYAVTSVSLVDSDKKWVDLSSQKNTLTLSTCDVFGQKQQRFVVEAALSK